MAPGPRDRVRRTPYAGKAVGGMETAGKLAVGEVPIAAEDHGGQGRDVVLLHGGGRTRRDRECPLAVNLDGHGNPTRPDQFSGLDATEAAHACREMTAFLAEMGQGLPESFLQVMREIDALDLFAAYRAARCPVLVVSGDAMAFAAVFPDSLAPAWKAYCVRTRRQLEAVTGESSLVRETSLPTGHDPHLELKPGARTPESISP